VHAQYCKTEERMPIRSNFSNGYRKAVAILEYQGGKADAFISDQQEYKYGAHAVIDEETGKSIEYIEISCRIPSTKKPGPEQQLMNLVDYLMEQVKPRWYTKSKRNQYLPLD
jgi:hypothetical protein